MSSEPVVRTSYIDPRTQQDRRGTARLEESKVDQEKYSQPLERLHASGLHGWGIAEGLTVTATRSQADVRVLPGVAVDANGRHISLAKGGKAEINPLVESSGQQPKLTDVTDEGALVPTDTRMGTFYLTMTYRETFDVARFNQSPPNQREFQMLHTPWLRLEAAHLIGDATDNGSRVVLGRVELVAGKVDALTHERRRGVSLPAGSLKLWRHGTGSSPTDLKTENAMTGEIRARAAGGLEITVPGASDQIDIRRDGGNIAKLALGAEQIVGRRADGKETVVIDPPAGSIRAGAQGAAGTVVVNDDQNRRAVVCSGNDATVSVGTAGNAGDVLVLNNSGQASVRIDGNAGTIHGGAQGVAGTVVVHDAQNRDAVVCTGTDATVSVGTAGNAGDVLVLNNSGQAAARIDGNASTIHTGTQGVAGTVVVHDDQNRGAVVCSGSDATVSVGAAGNAGDVLVLNTGGQAAVRIDGNAGTIHSGAQGFAGTVVVHDDQNRSAVVCAGSDATVSVGAAGNAGDVLVLNNAGQAAVRIDGNAGTIQTGTQGVAGTVVVSDAQNRRAVVCTGSDARVTVGTAGNSGDVLVLDNAGKTAVVCTGSDATVSVGTAGNAGDIQVLDNAGVASVRIDGNGGTIRTNRLAPASSTEIHLDGANLFIHGSDVILDGRSGTRLHRALVDDNDHLIINFAANHVTGDYVNGVDVYGLHLAPHIKTGYWEGAVWEGTFEYNVATELVVLDTQLPASQWDAVSFCDVSMVNDVAPAEEFWWATWQASFINAAGNIVIRWMINVGATTSPGWHTASRKVFWLAFRR